MAINDYYLFMAETPAELSVIIEEQLAQGWELYGSPVVAQMTRQRKLTPRRAKRRRPGILC